MAKAKKFVPDSSILEIVNAVKPATPVMTGPEKTYFKGLKRRGYSEQQINEFIKKAGYPVPADLWVVKAKKPLAAQIPTRV